MIIYIHGFGSCGEGSKAKLFRAYYSERAESFIAPSLSYIPELAIATLEELIESYSGDVKLIGSSLGGFYAIYLAQKYNLQAVLINPSIFPYKTLANFIGNAPSFHDGSSYEWRASHVEMLKKYEATELNPEDFLLLLQKGDDLLDHREALAKFTDAKVILEDGGSHSFEGIGRHFEAITRFVSRA